ncbi:MAG TPA: hypothetical protein VHO25_19590, partial [Polyangiaceae bacterium]|nr:hypothetical protein [Polyangiaceae bacterium]
GGRCERTTEPPCPLGWGCEPFDQSQAVAASECHLLPSPVAGMACGYRVIQLTGNGFNKAFYDSSSGELVGISAAYDNGPPACSGDIPSDCADVGGIEDEQQLCDNEPSVDPADASP